LAGYINEFVQGSFSIEGPLNFYFPNIFSAYPSSR
jgi:hypothetical protein